MKKRKKESKKNLPCEIYIEILSFLPCKFHFQSAILINKCFYVMIKNYFTYCIICNKKRFSSKGLFSIYKNSVMTLCINCILTCYQCQAIRPAFNPIEYTCISCDLEVCENCCIKYDHEIYCKKCIVNLLEKYKYK
jgi:hypothetical protein